MKISDKYLKDIYSSAPLEESDFISMSELKEERIFKTNFFEHDFRKKMIQKLKKSLTTSQGGVFLVSGYRGIGKTTFLNYIKYTINKEESDKYIFSSFNLSSISFKRKEEIKKEIMYRIGHTLEENRKYLRPCRIKRKVNHFLDYLLYEKTITSNIQIKSTGFGWLLWIFKSFSIVSGFKHVKKKKVIYSSVYAETLLHDILKELKRKKRKIIIVLDELDKIPILSEKQNELVNTKSSKKEEMDWLLHMLSDIKYLLFESGIVFLIVVNKDVYDYWKYNHSQDDLFMHLVTNMLYIPGYFKEEMKLSDKFKITFEDVIPPDPYSPHTIKELFQRCIYYESYGNPRIFFQCISRKINNNEIRFNQYDIDYLISRINLFSLNDLLYSYVYRKEDYGFRQMLFSINILSKIFNIIDRKKEEDEIGTSILLEDLNRTESDLVHIFSKYEEIFYEEEIFLKEMWNSNIVDEREVSQLYLQFENLLTILRELDETDNYPTTNYLMRRIVDFVKIIENTHIISIEDLINRMNFEAYEKNDVTGKYLIGLILPLCIVLLINRSIIRIQQFFIVYNYSFDLNIRYLHLAFEHELNGNFVYALENYNRYIERESDCIDALFRKISLLYYMIRLGFYKDEIDIKFHWKDCLDRIYRFLKNCNTDIRYNLVKAKYEHCKYFYIQYMCTNSKKSSTELLDDNDYLAFHEVEERFDVSIARYPFDSETQLWKAYFLYWRGYHHAALKYFIKSAEMYKDPKAYIRLADTYINIGENDEAFNKICKAIEISTSCAKKSLIINCFVRLLRNKKYSISTRKIDKYLSEFLKDFDENLLKENNYHFLYDDIVYLKNRFKINFMDRKAIDILRTMKKNRDNFKRSRKSFPIYYKKISKY